MIQVGILGPLEVYVDGEAAALGGPRQRAVLGRLLIDPRRVVSADRIIDDVWEGHPPDTARKTLHKYVFELRKVLPAALLRTVPAGYVLDVDDEAIDSRRFERLVAERRFGAALALWRGDPLADLPDLGFLAPERARLDELRLFAIESRVEDDLDAGRHGSVIGELTDLVAVHPLRERLTASLMLALYRAGRQVEALRTFERHRRHLAEEIGIEPAADLRDLEDAILRHDACLELAPIPSHIASASPGNVPTALTSFVGRADEMASVARALDGNRLVTISGPGGVGKTRLAQHVGRRVADRFPGGVWMVDLAGIDDADLVPLSIATAAGFDTGHAPDDLTAVTAALAHRPATLVILDNCEHLVETVARVATAILGCAPDARVLATSRRPLGVDGEFVRPLQPLAEAEATQLFADRARLADSEGPPVAAEQASEICRRLDGLPLAIELAASQLRLMDVEEVLARLGSQLTFRGTAPGGPARQRTLGDMVQWSYAGLTPASRLTFARLGVFMSSFTLSAAERVCADAPDTGQVLSHITTLIDHSLLVRDPTSGRPARFRLLETLRLFALERLAEIGEIEQTRRAHAEFFRGTAEQAGRQMYGPDEHAWRTSLEIEEPNLHAALNWAADHDPLLAMRLAVALWPYWDARWRERKGVEYIEDLLRLDIDVPADVRAWLLTAIAAMGGNAGEARLTIPRAHEAVVAQRAIGDDRGLAEALAALGLALGNGGRLAEADLALEEGLAIARRLHDPLIVARLLDRIGFVAGRRGDHARAAEVNREELAALTALGSRRGEATALRHLAVSINHLGEYEEAIALCNRALEIWKDLEDPAAIAHVQTTLADLARLGGDLPSAERIYREALVDLQAIGDRRCTASTHKNLATVASLRGDRGAAAQLYLDALALRHEMGDEAGLAEVLEGLASVRSVEGRDDAATTLIAAAEAVRARTGSLASPAELAATVAVLDAGRRRLGDGRFDAVSRSGAAMSAEEIVEFAMSDGTAGVPAGR